MVLCLVLYHVLVCLCFDFPCPTVSFKCLFCSSLCLPLSVVLVPPCSLFCAPPPRYLTWPPPSSLPSPVPRLVISGCVLSLSLLFLALLVHASVHVCSCLLQVPVCFGIEFSMFDLNFAFFFATLPFVPFSLFVSP